LPILEAAAAVLTGIASTGAGPGVSTPIRTALNFFVAQILNPPGIKDKKP
jgi:hypothetical protein